jgi:hypothetical protein
VVDTRHAPVIEADYQMWPASSAFPETTVEADTDENLNITYSTISSIIDNADRFERSSPVRIAVDRRGKPPFAGS